LSVVIPVYNVAHYLKPCLQSLKDLPLKAAEFLVINDGSTDDSRAVSGDFLQQDRRFLIIDANRVGIREARNIGVRASSGKFLAFLDGDDVVMPDGYMAAYDMLQSSGSDLVSFAFRRLVRGETKASKLNFAHKENSERTSFDKHPRLAFASVAWNKIYRREFFVDVIGGFDDGIFEDIFPTLKAISESSAIDVSKELGVLWRVRDDRSSITQQNQSSYNTTERIRVLGNCLDYISDRPLSHQAAFLRKVTNHDLVLTDRGRENLDSEEQASAEQFAARVATMRAKVRRKIRRGGK